ncbi:hypothetical protein BESB_034030 [Besnoitia besnoiti]|uniref:SRS domain-containing protein n=1 Tax=Besnoitia besnoiti TaxID=94643 RepID=A0A2A9MG27_BESBE|nr:hypothetical protein BESB_034030 [Besnoitia besnoiti]PFH36945.1 hypothetical protein BESB_034030 [Besnoitia besnoiti]
MASWRARSGMRVIGCIVWTALILLDVGSAKALKTQATESSSTGNVKQCEPKPEPNTMETVTMEPQVTEIKFQCGTNGAPVLEPQHTKANSFYETQECSGTMLQLDTVRSGAGLSASSDGGTSPTYTLTIPSDNRTAKKLYYKCSLTDQVRPEVVTFEEEEKKPLVKTKSCVLEINVKTSTSTSPPPEPIFPGNGQTGNSGNDTSVDLVPSCDPEKSDKSYIFLTVEPETPSVTFACGAKNKTKLSPTPGSNSVFIDDSCSEQKLLSGVCSGATLKEHESGESTRYTIEFSSKPEQDRDLYYQCRVRQETRQNQGETELETPNGKTCRVKITVKAKEGSTPSTAYRGSVSSCFMGSALLGFFYA